MNGLPSGGSPRTVAAGAMALPVVGLLVVRLLLPDPVTKTSAAVPVMSTDTGIPLMPDEAWLRAITSSSRREPIDGSPFYYPAVLESEPDDELSEIVEELDDAAIAEIVEEPVPEVRVTAIMRSGSGCMALIDGKAVTLGAKVASGWLLTEIDEQERSVTIQSETDGREAVITLDPPF